MFGNIYSIDYKCSIPKLCEITMSKVKYTEKEVLDINNACDVLDVIKSHPHFESLINEIYGKGRLVKEVHTILSRLDKSRRKVNKGVKDEKIDTGKREIYFTKMLEPTASSLILAELTSDIPDLDGKLRFRQDESTCQIDIRVMLYAYIRYNDLRDSDKGVRIDKNMRNLAPNVFGKMEYVAKDDKKSIPRAIMEIIHF